MQLDSAYDWAQPENDSAQLRFQPEIGHQEAKEQNALLPLETSE